MNAAAHYRVERDNQGCEACGHGRNYVVIAPNGIAIGIGYESEDDACEMAELLSVAYDAGLHAGRDHP